jgi:DNA-binding NarL/FixJ family response regulator
MRLLSDAVPTDTRRHLEGMTDAPSPRSCVSRLLIADDRSRTRRALRAVLSTQPEIELIGEAADGEEAIAAVERLRPDVVILDIRMPRLDGIAATRRIKSRWPEIRIIAHSLAEELRADVLAAGADAFVPKGAPVQELLEALGHQTGDQRADTNVSPPSQYS